MNCDEADLHGVYRACSQRDEKRSWKDLGAILKDAGLQRRGRGKSAVVPSLWHLTEKVVTLSKHETVGQLKAICGTRECLGLIRSCYALVYGEGG